MDTLATIDVRWEKAVLEASESARVTRYIFPLSKPAAQKCANGLRNCRVALSTKRSVGVVVQDTYTDISTDSSITEISRTSLDALKTIAIPSFIEAFVGDPTSATTEYASKMVFGLTQNVKIEKKRQPGNTPFTS